VIIRRSLVVLALLVGAACRDSTAPPKPSALVVVSGPPGSSTVGSQIATISVTVRDEKGNAMAGQPLSVSVSGGGTVTGVPGKTQAGATAVGTWTLGTRVGTNAMTISSGTLPAVTLTVVAQADVPAALQVTQGAGQSANAGAPLALPPVLSVTDRFGNGVPQQVVTFSVVAGGGSLAGGATVTSDTNGVATGPTWVLGKRNIPQQLSASAAGFTRTIDATISTAMTVTLRFFGAMTDAQKAVFQGGAQRISALITRGADPVQADAFPIATACDVSGAAPLTELIDGIVIYASIGPIDGAGQILAQAGPCAFREAEAHFQPAIATILFDVADLATLTGGGSLENVATHEMMHGVGFGTLWQTNLLLAGLVNVDPRYVGPNGIGGCRQIGGVTTCAATVPVENTGGAGTAGGHWRETVFGSEMMTGFLNPGASALSLMSIAAMSDLGYSVSLTAADAYSIQAALRGAVAVRLLPDNWEQVRMPVSPMQLERAGGLLRIRRGLPK